MRRIFRAFLWMRWRVLVNSLERTSARDTLERFAVATEKLGPIIALVLLIPSSIALFGLGLISGFGLATGSWAIPMEIVRYFLLVALAITLFGPLILPTRDTGGIVRLLLLPIPGVTMFLAQMFGAIGDPWVALTVPLLLGIVIGLAAGLKLVATLIALAAGAAFVLFLMGITSCVSSVVHLLLRDRRRGEIVMFVIVLLIPIVAMAPQFLLKAERQGNRRLTRAERAALPPSRAARAITAIAPYVPSEMYRRATIGAATSPARSALPLAELALLALAVQGAAFAAYRRVIDMPLTLGARRAGAFGGLWDLRIPGLSRSASAVAFTQLRLALRTPRGKATIASPLIIPIVFSAIAYRSTGRGPFPGMDGQSALPLAIFGVAVSLLALLPLAVNQFAIDKAGFTRQMLAPLSVRDLLIGKAVGNALIAVIPAVFGLIVPVVLFPIGRLGDWPALFLAALATYLLFAPAAAFLSALFPKTVDLNSIGNASNAHQAAGLLGMLCFLASAAPAALLWAWAAKLLRRPDLAPAFLAVWLAVALAISVVLFIAAGRFVSSRRETLAQYY